MVSSILSNTSSFSLTGKLREAPLDMEIAFTRVATIPQDVWDKVDKGLMAYDLIVRNVPNPYDEEAWYLRFKFNQTVVVLWSTNNDYEKLRYTNTTETGALKGLVYSDSILPKSRKLLLTFLTNYPYYAVGQISLVIYQDKLEYQRLATFIFN
ncbi:hypothetical protein HDU96_009634, partial [Phlyctochytrium bullatum]